MDKEVHVKLFSFQGNAGIGVLEVLSKLLVSQVRAVIRPISQSIFQIFLTFLCLLAQAPDVWMLICPQIGQKRTNCNSSILLKLLESMIDSRIPLLRHIIPDIINKLSVRYSTALREGIPNCPYFLSSEEDSSSIEQKIEGMLGERTRAVGIVFGDLKVEMEEVFVLPAEELELEFIIDLGQRVHPVHWKLQLLTIKQNNN